MNIRPYLCIPLLVAATSAYAVDPPTAARASRQETTGVASGMVIGAAAAGPFGAMLGAATGAWLGDRLHREHSARMLADRDLAMARAGGQGLETEVLFRTGDDQLRPGDVDRLQHFAALLATLPGARVHVAGFTDPRGGADYNAQLSARRAAAVAAQLTAFGIDTQRLAIEAHGAGASAALPAVAGTVPDLDGYAFERRVSLRIEADAVRPAATSAAVARRD
jgi:outer membrane protein OmpA-like peptidoglycan-associated protein